MADGIRPVRKLIIHNHFKCFVVFFYKQKLQSVATSRFIDVKFKLPPTMLTLKKSYNRKSVFSSVVYGLSCTTFVQQCGLLQVLLLHHIYQLLLHCAYLLGQIKVNILGESVYFMRVSATCKTCSTHGILEKCA